MWTMRTLITTSAAVATLLLVCQPSHAGEVKAKSYWVTDVTEGSFGCSGAGTWTLGANEVKINGVVKNTAPQKSGSYPGSDVVIAQTALFGASATATSQILGRGCLNSTLYLNASADSTGVDSAGAIAVGTDPQFVLFPGLPGVVLQSLSLDIDSSIFVQQPGIDQAAVFFALIAFDLADPLASITVSSLGGGNVFADVILNDDPRLTFLDPDTYAPTTAGDIKARLEASDLGQEAGLANALSLFTYQYDLSSTSLPPEGAPFGFFGINLASSGNP